MSDSMQMALLNENAVFSIDFYVCFHRCKRNDCNNEQFITCKIGIIGIIEVSNGFWGIDEMYFAL